jgi:hypothetical protein
VPGAGGTPVLALLPVSFNVIIIKAMMTREEDDDGDGTGTTTSTTTMVAVAVAAAAAAGRPPLADAGDGADTHSPCHARDHGADSTLQQPHHQHDCSDDDGSQQSTQNPHPDTSNPIDKSSACFNSTSSTPQSTMTPSSSLPEPALVQQSAAPLKPTTPVGAAYFAMVALMRSSLRRRRSIGSSSNNNIKIANGPELKYLSSRSDIVVRSDQGIALADLPIELLNQIFTDIENSTLVGLLGCSYKISSSCASIIASRGEHFGLSSTFI